MNEKTREILFSKEIPDDLLVHHREVPVYDVAANATRGGSVSYPLPYNAVKKMWVTPPSVKAERYLYERLVEAGYAVWKPFYDGMLFNLLTENEGRRYLIVFVLDSESERKLWRALELSESYRVVVVREKAGKEAKGAVGVGIDEVFDSFNFLTR